MGIAETKKAWERCKKELFKGGDPLMLKGCMYMNAQQMQKGTATIDLGWCEGEERAKKCREKANAILASEAYKRLASEIGVKHITLEVKENAYYSNHLYMRLHY